MPRKSRSRSRSVRGKKLASGKVNNTKRVRNNTKRTRFRSAVNKSSRVLRAVRNRVSKAFEPVNATNHTIENSNGRQFNYKTGTYTNTSRYFKRPSVKKREIRHTRL
jgi:hypothetical protein